MRANVLIVLVFSAAFSCLAGSAVTNAVSGVASVASATNAPVAKLLRQQCEAVTKSGNRCKRNSIPGGKLCRQHQRINDRSEIGGGGVKRLGCRAEDGKSP